MASTVSIATFVDLLTRAVSEPGVISRAYRAFHGYSIGNQLLALWQCAERGLQPGPINTFMGWKAKGRSVQKGAKAIVLCMPVTCRTRPDRVEGDDQADQPTTFTRFVYRPHWFVVSQTAGEPLADPTVGAWSAERALAQLAITEEPFTMIDGNCQGYARGRSIAISPVAELPYKTRFHELAHVVLGHTSEQTLSDGPRTPRSLAEVEAEAVALVCLEALDLPGAEHCRGYIQHWNASGAPIPERSAQRIFKAADAILRAGRAELDDDGETDAVAA